MILGICDAVAEGAKRRSASLKAKPQRARKFYGVMAIAIIVGLAPLVLLTSYQNPMRQNPK
jgi:hypothetical protein